MNEREMLEFAAKAMGCEVLEVFDGGNLHVNGPGIHKVGWNSLEDDGDALRLAVTLGICIVIESGRVICNRIYAERQGLSIHSERLANNPCAATRRAITRAAAEIGKAMP